MPDALLVARVLLVAAGVQQAHALSWRLKAHMEA